VQQHRRDQRDRPLHLRAHLVGGVRWTPDRVRLHPRWQQPVLRQHRYEQHRLHDEYQGIHRIRPMALPQHTQPANNFELSILCPVLHPAHHHHRWSRPRIGYDCANGHGWPRRPPSPLSVWCAVSDGRVIRVPAIMGSEHRRVRATRSAPCLRMLHCRGGGASRRARRPPERP